MKTSSAEIHDTNAEVHDTSAKVTTVWTYTPEKEKPIVNTIKLVVGNIPVAFVDVEVRKDGKLVETATSDLDGIVHFTHEIDQSYTLKILGKEYGVNDIVSLNDNPALVNISYMFIAPTTDGKISYAIKSQDGKVFSEDAPSGSWIEVYLPKSEKYVIKITDNELVPLKFAIIPNLVELVDSKNGDHRRVLGFIIPQKEKAVDIELSNFQLFLDTYPFQNSGTEISPDGICYGMASTTALFYGYNAGKPSMKFKLPIDAKYLRELIPQTIVNKNTKPVKRYNVIPYTNYYLAILLHQKDQSKVKTKIPFEEALAQIKQSNVVLADIYHPLEIRGSLSPPSVKITTDRHALLILGYIKFKDPISHSTTYLLLAYDPNFPFITQWVKYYPDKDSIEVVYTGGNKTYSKYNKIEFYISTTFDYKSYQNIIDSICNFLIGNQDYKLLTNYLSNYNLVISSKQLHLTYTNSTGTYSGEFVDGKFYKSDIPYSAGFMEWSKENGNVEPFYAVIYPKKLDELGKVEVKTLTPPGDLDPYTVMTIEEDKITGFSVNSTVDVVTRDEGGSYVLEANGSGNIKISKFTITNNSYENTTLSFEGTNSKVYLDNASVRVDLDGDGTVDETIILPHAEFTFSPDTAGVNEPITFSASSAGGSAVSYVWDFGDGSTASGQVITHSYSRPGTYVVTLTVTGEDGVSVSTSKTVIIQPMIFLVPPTPENNTAVGNSYVFVNMTSNEPLESAFLEWNGERLLMKSKSPTNWYINVTGLESGEYTFSVWGKDENDHWGVSETRIITVKLSTTTTPTQTTMTSTSITTTSLTTTSSHGQTTTTTPHHTHQVSLLDKLDKLSTVLQEKGIPRNEQMLILVALAGIIIILLLKRLR